MTSLKDSPLFRFSSDVVLKGSAGFFAALGVSLVGLIYIFLFKESHASIEAVGTHFFLDSTWLPEPVASEGTFGIMPLILGSLLTCLTALAIAIPIGIFSAIGVVFHSHSKLAPFLRLGFEILAGIPSVVFGLWGLVSLVPIFQTFSLTGLSLLSASLILSLMILPTIVILSISALQNAHNQVHESAHALGIREQTHILKLVLPIAKQGIGISILLALARAIGETMVVVMLCGNIVQVPTSILQPVRTLTANIALEMSYAYADHRSSLFFTGLFLMLAVSLLLLTIEFVKHKHRSAETLC
jgi:phosphate transport system permease protein